MSHVLILGASGQVGQHVLRQALAEPRISHITAPSRRPLVLDHKLHNPLIDFAAMPTDAAWWQADIVICALGTTLKLAGSQAGFYQVDHDYVLQAAQLARAAGARSFVLNSSTGAKLNASSFYLRVKAEIERDVERLGYPSFTIVRPSLLIAENRPDRRRGEEWGLALSRLLRPLIPRRLRPIGCAQVAAAMLQAGLQMRPGCQVIESEQIAA